MWDYQQNNYLFKYFISFLYNVYNFIAIIKIYNDINYKNLKEFILILRNYILIFIFFYIKFFPEILNYTIFNESNKIAS